MLHNKFHKTGFTLIEVLIAVSIVTILSGISLASYSFFNQRKRLDGEGDRFRQTLEVAKKKAVANDKSGLILSGTDHSTCDMPSISVNITSASTYSMTAHVCDNTGSCPLVSGCSDITLATYSTVAPIVITPTSGSISFDTTTKSASGLGSVTFTHSNLNQQVSVTIDNSGLIY